MPEHSTAGHYPPAATYINRSQPGPASASRERERSATRLARLGTNADRQNPAAVVYIAGQAVCVEVRNGELRVNVAIAEDDRDVFRAGDSIPVRFDVEGAAVATVDEHGTVHAAGHADTSRM